MAKQDKLMWLAIGAIVIIILLPYLGLVPKFEIVDSDIVLQDLATLNQNESVENFLNVNLVSGTINFMYLNSSYNYPSGKILYFLDNSTFIYDGVPEMTEGTHILFKYQFISFNNDTQIKIQKGSKNFYNSIQNVEVPVEVIKLVNNTIIVNQTVNQTITKEVQVAPTVFQKYGIAGIIFVIMGLIIIYLIYKRTR